MMRQSPRAACCMGALLVSASCLASGCGTGPEVAPEPRPRPAVAARAEPVREEPSGELGTEPPAAASATPVGISIAEAAERIQVVGRGLIVFFSLESRRSQQIFPELVELSQTLEGKVPLLVFSTDQDEGALTAFLDEQGAGFEVEQVRPWQGNELRDALEPIGIAFSGEVPLPWVAVVAENGDVLGRWQGMGTLKPAAKLFEEP